MSSLLLNESQCEGNPKTIQLKPKFYPYKYLLSCPCQSIKLNEFI